MGILKLAVCGATKVFAPSGLKAFGPITFDLRANEIVAIVGPSGCGKTTLLRVLAELDEPSAGEVARRPTADRSAGPFSCLLFQNLALLPWRTVRENIALGPRFHGKPKKERLARAGAWARRLHLDGFEDYYPDQLSGGMAHRVALAQTLAADAEVLLLDEPFGALDSATRRLLQAELLSLLEAERMTALLITHDVDEALLLADRILLLTSRPGRIAREIVVPFGRPRSEALRRERRFFEFAVEIWRHLDEEVAAARSLQESS